jgi:hypothetical protein
LDFAGVLDAGMAADLASLAAATGAVDTAVGFALVLAGALDTDPALGLVTVAFTGF